MVKSEKGNYIFPFPSPFPLIVGYTKTPSSNHPPLYTLGIAEGGGGMFWLSTGYIIRYTATPCQCNAQPIYGDLNKTRQGRPR